MAVKLQKLESVAILIALLLVYYALGFNWLWFVLFILVPDVFMVGYLKNPKIGAIIYNIGHVYLAPIALGFLSYYLESSFGIALSITWASHIAADRMLGFGLKLPGAFKQTHLGNIK